MSPVQSGRPRPQRWLQGAGEPIFDVLPETILANTRHPNSENALLWNSLYPRLWPTRPLSDFMAIRPLWGTREVGFSDEGLRPYFWGYGVDGERLPGLEPALDAVEGSGPRTEVDLFLAGDRQLVVIEAKHTSGLGRCSRYGAGRCPEVHAPDEEGLAACRYWEVNEARFDHDLDILRPTSDAPQAACNRHYQLARTLRLGTRLAADTGRSLHLWLFAPQRAWRRSLQRDWIDFADRVKPVEVWRRMRVIAWEDILQLPPG